VRVTKKQLKRIIKEERTKLLKEWGAAEKESLSPLIQFAQAWAGLGDAVQSQMIDVINGHIENNEEAVYEINPNALDVAVQRLSRPLDALRGSVEAEEIMGALDWAEDIFTQGELEVDADARAAGDL